MIQRSKEAIRRGIVLYISGTGVYGLGIALCRSLPYLQKILSGTTQQTLLYFYWSFLIISPFYYFFFSTRYSTSRPYFVVCALKKIFWHIARGEFWKRIRQREVHHPETLQNGGILQNNTFLEKEEKTALLFIVVKFFFLPLMVNFFINNFNSLLQFKKSFITIILSLGSGGFLEGSTFPWYSALLTLAFTIDTFVFAVGYTFESRSLRNTVRSVEPTLLGWAVALICYPPFNSLVGKYVPWGANDHVLFWNEGITSIFRFVLIALLLIYVAATLALGMRSSNLTNRGIVCTFPYSLVRHPAYISKNLIWWLTLLPVINWKFALGMAFWTIIYGLRAITEEKHLSQDQDYVEYKKKVKWMFIPYVI